MAHFSRVWFLCSLGTRRGALLYSAMLAVSRWCSGARLHGADCPCPQRMTAEAQRRVVVEYLRAVMQKRISFRSPEERKEGADRMVREAEQLRFLFRKLASGFGEDAAGYCDTITAVAEVIKLTDPSLLYLEVSTLVSKYPDIRDDHIGALLAVRGDASRDMKQTIIESLEQGPTQASPNYVPIFREIMVPSLNVAKLLK